MDSKIFRNPEVAKDLLWERFGVEGKLIPLPGELDANYKVETSKGSYLLKISKPETDPQVMDFESKMLEFLSSKETIAETPEFLPDIEGNCLSKYQFGKGEEFLYARLLRWMEGKLWSDFPEYNVPLMLSLGEAAGSLALGLQDFHHHAAKKENFDWDIAEAAWTEPHQHLFQGEQRELILYFYEGFEGITGNLQTLRKSVVHNDLNDNNLVLRESATGQMEVAAVIDFGDATYTASIIDLAVCLTYAMMDKTAPMEAGLHVIKGYHEKNPLLEEELEILYWLIGARLVISLTKSKMNAVLEPENTYHQISARQAWDLIRKWRRIDKEEATSFFRKSCGYSVHRNSKTLKEFLHSKEWSLEDLISGAENKKLQLLDLDVSSAEISDFQIFRNPGKLDSAVRNIWEENNKPILASGYAQIRPDYLTDTFLKRTNKGNYWEALLLGTEFWFFEDTEIKALLPGKIIIQESIVTIEHEMTPGRFLYVSYFDLDGVLENGQVIEQQQVLGRSSGETRPLFLQLSLIRPKGEEQRKTCRFEEAPVFKELFPDPALCIPSLKKVSVPIHHSQAEQIASRKKHLGKSLSLSYKDPLHMVRGEGIYLISHTGRKYMDLVNNVAHVGHEHPQVVAAGQRQMAMLNTNSRYLHGNILQYAENLLSTLPEELSVVHWVNSGSEANELAIRMAKAYTGQKDFIALEVGYHGNTNACIDVSSYKFDGKGGAGAPPHTHIIPLPDSFRGKYIGENCGPHYAAHVHEKIQQLEEQGRKPAAMIAESIVSCGGQIVLPSGFLREAYSTVRDAGGLCIADEVQIGCGRMGKSFWGFELHEVVPDIVTIGKPLGNGHPLGAVVCTKAVAETFANGMEYFNTFGGNPVSCAIGNKVLEIVKEEKLQENAEEMGNYLMEELRKVQQDNPILADIRGQGLFIGIDLADRDRNPLPHQCSYLVERMLEQGFLMSSEGPGDNVLKIKPPMVFNRENANHFLENLTLVLKETPMKNY